MDLKPTLISNPHPLLGDGREYHYASFLDGETLSAYCVRNKVDVPKANIALFVGGERILSDWASYVPKHGDVITLRSVAQGSGGRKVFSIVAMIALAVAAPYAAGAMGLTAGTTGFKIATGLIMVGGSLLISAVLPPIKPAQMGAKEKEQSPTYGISAGRNQMSPYSPMTVVFGKHKLVPYLASKPYTTFVGDDQYLSQAFHLGVQPGIDISQIKIGETIIGNYREVEIQRSLADGGLTLVSGNVDTIEGFEFTQPDGWTLRTSPADTEFIDVDLTANLYNIANDGKERDEEVTVEAQYRKQGTTQWLPLGGSYSTKATHYWSLGYYTKEYGGGRNHERERTVWNQVRYGTTDPDEHTNGKTEQVLISTRRNVFTGAIQQEYKTFMWRWVRIPRSWQGVAPNPVIHTSGTGVQLLKGSSPQKPARATMSVNVPRGTYDIRVRKVTADINTSRRSNKTAVAQIRFTQADDADYSGQDRLAVRIKATSQLHGAIDELSVIASAKCLIWKNGTWVEEETSNPAWWYLHWALGRFDNNGHRVYGEGLPLSRIDVDGIRAWAAFCDAKNLTFNWVLDRKMSIEDVYYTIARAGRAGVTWQTGKRGVVFDSANIPTTTMITPANIIAGSYEYTYINTKVADEIIINFFNKDRDYAKDVVRQKVPGADDVNNPITLDLEGCTDVSMAGREANLLAASQHYHRKQHRWDMDIEGMLAVRGDVVEMTHDLNSWGQSGRLMGASGKTIVLDGYVKGVSGGWLSLRSPSNKIAYLRANGSGDTDSLTVTSNWPAGFEPPTDETAHDYLWQYDPVKTPGKKLHIKSVQPKSDSVFTFEAIEYVPEYYAAESGNFHHLEKLDSQYGYSPISVMDIIVTEKDADEATDSATVVITWLLSESAISNVSISANGVAHSQFNSVYGNQVSIIAKTGDDLLIEVTPFKAGRASESMTYNHVVAGTNELIPTPTGLVVIGGFNKTSVRIKWDRVLNATGYEVQVESGSAVRRNVKIGDTLTYTYSHADMLQDGGLTRTLTFKVRALGKGESKSGWVEVTATNPQIGPLQGIEVFENVKSLMFTCKKPDDEDFSGFLYWISDNVNFVPTVANAHFDGTFNQYFFEKINGLPLENKDYYIWAAGYDTFGKDNLNISPSYKAKPLLLKLDPQSITEEMIADGAFTITKFADNIKPPVVVTTMPTTGKENDQVILASTGKLYRYVGGVWKPVIQEVGDIDSLPADKIDGTLGLNQVPAIPTTKLTGQMQANQIAANAVGANHIAANAIDAGHVKARSLTGDKLVANSVTANELAANSVTVGKIAAGAVGADQISAGAITASKLTVTDFTNLVLNGQFLESDHGWTNVLITSSTHIPSGFEGRFQKRDAYYGNHFPVVSGEVFRVSADIWRFNTPIASCSVGLQITMSDKTWRWIKGFTVTAPGSWNPEAHTGLVTIPANAVSARFWVQYNIPGSDHQTSNFWRGANFQLNRAMTGQLIVDGSIKTQHMTANSIAGDRIAANTLNGDRVVANTLHGNRIQANTITADRLAANTITATSGKIANAAITNAMIANGAITDAKIANAAITSAKIANAAISSAKIGDLQVDRIKIANGAVSTLAVLNVTRTNNQSWSITFPPGNYLFEYTFSTGRYNYSYYEFYLGGKFMGPFDVDNLYIRGTYSATFNSNFVV
ncbi:host specificity factor TipJ family phage tail protein, partial [Oligella sp. HMSC09E12]|uniref:host specificity factor TipJ family phage tail protein n=1 Tax=Oligella sp. HMSC09E12 TaxID=1581147 RepID=UPI0008A58210